MIALARDGIKGNHKERNEAVASIVSSLTWYVNTRVPFVSSDKRALPETLLAYSNTYEVPRN